MRLVVSALLLLGSGVSAQTVPIPATPAQSSPAQNSPAQTAPGTTAPARSAVEQAALIRGRALMLEFYAVRLGNLWTAFAPEVQEQWGSLAGFQAFREAGVQQYGQEQELVQEQTMTRAGETFYIRSAVFEGAPKQVWALVIGFTGQQVTTFTIGLLQDRSDDEVAGLPHMVE